MASGRYIDLEHHPSKGSKCDRSAVNGGMPSRNVGEAEAEHLRSRRFGDKFPRRWIWMGHRNRRTRSPIGGLSPVCCQRGERGHRSIRYAVEILISQCLVEHTAFRSRDAGAFQHKAHPVHPRELSGVHSWAIHRVIGDTRRRVGKSAPRRVVGAGDHRVIQGQLLDPVGNLGVFGVAEAGRKNAQWRPETYDRRPHRALQGNFGRRRAERRRARRPQRCSGRHEKRRLACEQ